MKYLPKLKFQKNVIVVIGMEVVEQTEKNGLMTKYGNTLAMENKSSLDLLDLVKRFKSFRENATFTGCQGLGGDVSVGQNTTISDLWQVCSKDEKKIHYEIEAFCDVNGTKIRVGQEYRDGSFQWLCLSTGRWITGCYYFNETQTDLLLRVGENAFNGLIEHVCSKRQEYPAIIQYYTQVRKDVDVKHPNNKGINRNFPEPLQKLIDEDQNVRWLHNSAVNFVKNDEKPRSFTRYLPDSRKPLGE
uniref:Decapping nuclease n=1 Tax=Caenorhabditis tropicalis TaxID=1561998 RepID=A0A1I7U524_9PELO